MYDSESDESIKPWCSDDDSGHLGQSQSESNESERQLLNPEFAPSVTLPTFDGDVCHRPG